MGMHTLEEARAEMLQVITPLAAETIPLSQAGGRVLATEAQATIDLPRFDNSAMDGYAVRAEDSSGATREQPRTVTRVETLFTGQVSCLGVGGVGIDIPGLGPEQERDHSLGAEPPGGQL